MTQNITHTKSLSISPTLWWHADLQSSNRCNASDFAMHSIQQLTSVSASWPERNLQRGLAEASESMPGVYPRMLSCWQGTHFAVHDMKPGSVSQSSASEQDTREETQGERRLARGREEKQKGSGREEGKRKQSRKKERNKVHKWACLALSLHPLLPFPH